MESLGLHLMSQKVLEALDDIFAPQTNCCPWGNEKSFQAKKLSLLFYNAEFC